MSEKREWALVIWIPTQNRWEKVYASQSNAPRLFYDRLHTDMSTTFTLEEGLQHLADCVSEQRIKPLGQYALFNIFTAEMIDGSIVQR